MEEFSYDVNFRHIGFSAILDLMKKQKLGTKPNWYIDLGPHCEEARKRLHLLTSNKQKCVLANNC